MMMISYKTESLALDGDLGSHSRALSMTCGAMPLISYLPCFGFSLLERKVFDPSLKKGSKKPFQSRSNPTTLSDGGNSE